MEINLSKYSSIFWNLFLLGLFGFTIYFLIRYGQYGVDIKLHNLYLEEYLDRGFFPIPPGYYFLIYLLDLLFRIKYPFVLSSLLVLTFFIWWKYRIMLAWLSDGQKQKINSNHLLALALVFIGPIVLPAVDREFWYFGKFSPTVWHNSTLIAVLPFSLILFSKTILWWENRAQRFPWAILGLGLLILAIKPSFLFCFVPLFPLFSALYFSPKGKPFAYSCLVSFFLLAGIGFEKILVYNWDPIILEDYSEEELPKIAIQPFKVWLHYAFEPFWDFFSSFSLSILFLLLWGKKAFQNKKFTFSFFLLLLALLIYFLFAETGFRQWHANFFWQIPITLLIHQALMLSFVIEQKESNQRQASWKTRLFFLLFSLNLICGIAYWLRIFTDRIIS
ncbi:hypothetical protein Ataiwa_25780 [Algoriphagus taiwanensis]|uniref:Mannosyltransferase n=2 Tax=Algoriphagus taiwanensis TaxID=1445656 RepID=A0ABQ6Q345_9BACT|nr:hypothetical protein Ataiwa_25780 [Algoriphagus taiwanensis]